MNTIRGLKPSENIADFLVKFEKLSLGRSAMHTKIALEKFAQVLGQGSQQADIDLALREVLGCVTFSVSQYATTEPDSSSSAHQFIETAALLVASLSDLYGNLGSSQEFWEHLKDYSENSGNIDQYKTFLIRLYQTTAPTPHAVHSIGSGRVFESRPPISAYSDEITDTSLKVPVIPEPPRPTDLGVGKLQPDQPVPQPVIPKQPAAESFAGLSSLFNTSTPASAGHAIEDETTTVSPVSADLVAQTLPTAQPEPTVPQLLPEEESEGDRTNPRIDIAALTATNAAIIQARRQQAAAQPQTKPTEKPAVTSFTSNSSVENNSASGVIIAPIVVTIAPGTPATSMEVSQPTAAPEEAQFAPFTSQGNPGLGLPVYTPSNPGPRTAYIPLPPIAEPARPSSTKKVVEQPQPAPFTSQGNPALGLPVIAPQNPDNPTNSSRSTLDGPYGVSHTIPGTAPLATPGVTSPTTRRSTDNRIAVRHIADEDATKITRLPKTQSSPKETTSGTRTAIYAVLGLAAASALGVGVWALYNNSKSANKLDTTSALASASASAASAASAKVAETPQTPKKAVDAPAPNYESGIYKVNTTHPDFKSYLDALRPASGLISLIKDFAGQTSIQYEQNPAKFAELQKAGKVVFNGTEKELDMRIAIAEKMVETALAQKIQNSYVRNFFENQKSGLANYKRTKAWTYVEKNHGVDKFFQSIQLPEKYVTPPNIIGYAPDIDPVQNPVIKRVASDAPNFYRVFQEVGKEMQDERDPAKIIRYRDFNAMKDATCDRIDKKGKSLKTSDERSGIAFMHSAWCSPTANPYNDLNKALMQVVEITEQPANSTQGSKTPNSTQKSLPGGNLPNNIIFNRVNLLDLPNVPSQNTPGQNSPKLNQNPSENPADNKPKHKVGMFNPAPREKLVNKYAAVETPAPVPTEQPIYFHRTINRIKSWFGFGKTAEVKTAQVTTPVSSNQIASAKPAAKVASATPLYTKKDIPMKSWTQSVKEFFWS